MKEVQCQQVEALNKDELEEVSGGGMITIAPNGYITIDGDDEKVTIDRFTGKITIEASDHNNARH